MKNLIPVLVSLIAFGGFLSPVLADDEKPKKEAGAEHAKCKKDKGSKKDKSSKKDADKSDGGEKSKSEGGGK